LVNWQGEFFGILTEKMTVFESLFFAKYLVIHKLFEKTKNDFVLGFKNCHFFRQNSEKLTLPVNQLFIHCVVQLRINHLTLCVTQQTWRFYVKVTSFVMTYSRCMVMLE